MLKSMTGFGKSVCDENEWIQIWEVKSVNGRFLDLKWRLPPLAHGLETRLEKIVRQYTSRGRVEISLDLTQNINASDVVFNSNQADAMLDTLESFASSRGDSFTPDYNALISIPSLWTHSDDIGGSELEENLAEGLAMALEDWNEARATEGLALARDLKPRIARMNGWVARIAERAPEIKEERIEIIRSRLAQTLAGVADCGDLDESRFLQEVVILVDKLDVSEELTRLSAHLERMRELLEIGEDAGRKLDFTLQECFREINTCGNKIQDAMLSRIVVDFKNELEKCREQVQNLE